MAFGTIRGARILSFFKCPFNYTNSASLVKPQRRLMAINASPRENSKQCAQPVEPACGNHFKAQPCELNSSAKKDKLPQPAPPAVHETDVKEIKRNINCCGDPCPHALPRFDKLFYRRSDKSQRTYQQTWDECPEMLIKPKVMCFMKPIKPKLEKRPRQERPQTACKQDVCLQSQTKCPYVNTPNCKTGRKPPDCLRTTKPSNCQKRRPPYPAFSECKRSKSRVAANECTCFVVPSICEVWAHYHRKNAIKKPARC